MVRSTNVTEAQLEKQFIQLCNRYKCKTYKWQTVGSRGSPDRAVVVPGDYAHVFFVELKKPGGIVSPHQEARAKELISLGFDVFVGLDSLTDLEQILKGQIVVARKRR